jgi:tRNA(Arg) A34 adenosine deaminase TadA/glycerol-3-phosphate cytidylyltransferase-like family protein
MNQKIISLQKLNKHVERNSIAVLSGSFEPFNEYYFRLIQWGAKQGRPFVVIIQKDDMVLKRRGFLPLSSTHKTRAEIISALEFVDYVVIANKTTHDEHLIDLLKPKIIVFQRDNFSYRKVLEKNIKHFHPEIVVRIFPFDESKFVSPYKNAKSPSFFRKTDNQIAHRLAVLSSLSNGRISKISAILSDANGKILMSVANNKQEEHAEILLLRMAYTSSLVLDQCSMYILIPPCLMCAREIAKSPIKKVYYLYLYGDGVGMKFLKKHHVSILRIK